MALGPPPGRVEGASPPPPEGARPTASWNWGSLALVLVLGGVLSALFLAIGGGLYRGLLALEERGVVARHALRTLLAGWGIGEHAFLVALSGTAIYGGFFVAVVVLVGAGLAGGVA